MKTKLILCLSIFLLSVSMSYAQKLTIGVDNGINYSNIRKTFDYNRFESQQGPVNGIFAKYELGNWFILQSGINHTTMYFGESNPYHYYDYTMNSSSSYYPQQYSSSSIIAPTYSSQATNKYSFLRIPLLIKFRTPGRVNFEIGGGYYYSFLTNDEFRGKDKDRFDKEYRDNNFPDMTDWGWILASSINYNINNKWSVFANGKITYGKEKYFENTEGTMGSTELTFGVGYKPFTKQREFVRNDSLGQRIQIIPHTGINISRVKSDKNQGEYSSSIGFSSGVSLKFELEENVSVISGAWYERKGYNLNYTGYYPAIYYVAANDKPNTQMKSEVQLDYLTIPLMIDILVGNKIKSHVNFGLYYSLLQNAFTEGERTITQEYAYGYQVSKEYFNESEDLMFKNTDWGFMLGYRIDIPVFKWASAFASVNQSFGITNILDDGEDAQAQYEFIDNESLKNSSTSVFIGFSIPVNKN